MNREDLKLVPLAALGLAKGVLEVFVKPFAIEKQERFRNVAAAAIHYYNTGPEPDASDQTETL